MRIALAKILFCEPDILLLDEPTNHLDIDAVIWLQDYLKNFKSTVVIVSHAREFLNEVCTDIISFENFQLKYYKGNFESYITTREQNTKRLVAEQKAQEGKIEHM